MNNQSFSDRLTALRIERRLTGRAFAKAAGLKASTYQALTTGRSPTLDTLVIIANSLGVNIEWLATGDGPVYPTKTEDVVLPRAQLSVPEVSRTTMLDPELFGRVVDRVAKVYREANVRLPEVDKGRIAAERYPDIADQAESVDEWPALLDLIEVRLKKALQTAVSAPGQTKREA